jgi:hypothetical protein
MLKALHRRIADHEAASGTHLTADERGDLRVLLHKLVYGGDLVPAGAAAAARGSPTVRLRNL